MNPIWYLYPQDEKSFSIDLQYFYGDCILVSPVTDENSTSVRIYLPDDVFYEWDTHQEVRGHGDWINIDDVAMDRIPIHVRGGCVVPLRLQSANTTTELRKQKFEILVAPGLDGTASGSLYVDDGVSLDGGPGRMAWTFKYENGRLSNTTTIHPISPATRGPVVGVEKITILGQNNGPV